MYGCLYRDINSVVSDMFRKLRIMVIDGNTDIMNLPYQYYHMLEYYNYYQNKKLQKKAADDEKERYAKEIMKRAPKSK